MHDPKPVSMADTKVLKKLLSVQADDSLTAERLAEALLSEEPEAVEVATGTDMEDMESKQNKDNKLSESKETTSAEATDAANTNALAQTRVSSSDTQTENMAVEPSSQKSKVSTNKEATQACLDMIRKAQDKVAHFRQCMFIDSTRMA